jgi:DNA-binding CsgD family transcriptional regulator
VTYQVTDSDLRALLDIVDVGRSDALVEEGMPTDVLERASDLVRCEVLSFVEFDDKRRILYFDQSLPVEAAEDGDELDAFWNNYWDDLSCCYPSVSGDTRTITTVSDFYTSRQMHETGMYVEYLGPLGLEHEAMMCLSAPAGRSRRLLFFRERGGPDFDDRDRLLLSLLRPHLNELYQELESRRRPQPNLTPRQWELMRLVAAGHSNAEIAKALVVSTTTVRKHLENIFDRLGVTRRTGAVARVFPSPPY